MVYMEFRAYSTPGKGTFKCHRCYSELELVDSQEQLPSCPKCGHNEYQKKEFFSWVCEVIFHEREACINKLNPSLRLRVPLASPTSSFGCAINLNRVYVLTSHERWGRPRIGSFAYSEYDSELVPSLANLGDHSEGKPTDVIHQLGFPAPVFCWDWPLPGPTKDELTARVRTWVDEQVAEVQRRDTLWEKLSSSSGSSRLSGLSEFYRAAVYCRQLGLSLPSLALVGACCEAICEALLPVETEPSTIRVMIKTLVQSKAMTDRLGKRMLALYQLRNGAIHSTTGTYPLSTVDRALTELYEIIEEMAPSLSAELT